MIQPDDLQQLAGGLVGALPHVRRSLRHASQQIEALHQLPHWLAALRAAQRVRELAADVRDRAAQLQPAPEIEQLQLDGEPCSPSCALRRRCAGCDMA